MNRKQVLSFILALSMTATSSGTFPVSAEDEKVELTPSKQSGNMTITLKIKKSITPSVKLSDWQYGSEPNKPEVEGNSGNGKVSYEYKVKDADDSTYTTAVPNKTGDYTVRATIAETDEYKSGTAEADFSITPFKTGMTIKLKIKNRIDPVVKIEDWQYGSKANVPEVEGNTGDAEVTFEYKPADAKDSEYTKAIPTAEGAYTVRAKVAETEEYYGGAAEADFNITPLKTGMTISLLIKETANLKVSLADWNYGYDAKTPVVTGNDGNGEVTYSYKVKGADDDTYTGTVPTAVGEYTVKASVPETDTHKAAEATADFTIGKAAIAPEVSIANWTYGEKASEPSVANNTGKGKVTYTYYKGEEKLDGVPTSAGTYTVEASIAETDNYEAGSASKEFTIAKAEIAPVVSITGWTYGETAKEPSVTKNSGNGAVTYTYYKGEEKLDGVPTSAGTYTVKASVDETANYTAGSASREFTVAKRSLKITADKAGKVYGTDDPALTYSVEGSLVGEDKITGSLSREKGDNTGEYKIGQGSLTAGDNYKVEFVSDKFTITPAEFKVKASGYSGAYDGKDHGIAASADVEDAKICYLVSETEPTEADFTENALTESLKYKNAGTYKIWYCITAPNYSTVISYQTVEITKAAISPKVLIANWTYGEKQGVPKIEGLPENTDFSAGVTYYKKGSDKALGAEPTDAGDYTVVAVIDESANYLGGEAEADFSIAKAEIKPSVTIEGWKNGETANKPVVTGNAGNASVKFEYMAKDAEDGKFSETVPTAVGTYVVKASVAETANYKAGSATAEFTIEHGHSYSDKWSYDESKHWRECTSEEGECDAPKTDVAEHTFTDWKVTKKATCEEAGTESRKCTVCGKEETRPVAATGHHFGEWKVTKQPTCTEKGVQTRYCADCDAFETKEIPATGHKYGTPVYTWSEDGKTCTATVICETDKKFTVTEEAKITGAVKTAATCDKKGVTTYTAKFENELFSAQTKDVTDIPATGHKYGKPVYAWSEDGKTCTATVTCENDKTHVITEKAVITGAVKTAATCDKNGVTTYTATFKNELFSVQTKDVEDIPAANHKFGKPEYTWSADGKSCTATVICETDKKFTVTEEAKITGAVKTAATCDKKGVTTYTATFRNELFSAQTKDVEDIPATGHKYGTPEYTWSADGKTCTATVICETDKKFSITEKAEVTSAVKTAATCDKNGVTTYTATFKNELFSAQTKDVEDIAATGHKYGKPVYTWSEDGKSCTATVICETDKKFSITEKAEITSAVKTAETCDRNGVTTYTAKFENKLFSAQTKDVEDIPATGHKFGKPEYTWSADGKSCTATVICETDKKFTVTEEAEIKSAVKVAADCENAGVTTYTATFKNELFSAQTKDVEDIPATGHKFGEWTVTKEATEEADGCETRICEHCGKEETNVILATVHEMGEWKIKKPATCLEDGIEERACVDCGKTETRVIKAAGEHKFGDWTVVKEATCEETGLEVRKCENCGEEETRVIPATGHKFGEWKTVTILTDETDGLEVRTCEHCGREEARAALATGHVFGEWTVTEKPTCEKTGIETRYCDHDDGTFETREIPAIGHKYGTPVYRWSEDGKTCTATVTCEHDKTHVITEKAVITGTVKTEATCEKNGVTTYTATFRNELFSAQTKDVEDIPATGHKYGTPVYTWSADGKTCTATVTCETDKKFTVTEEAVITSTVKTAATCDNKGVTTYTATFKNELFAVQTKDVEDIPATGEHKFGKWTINIVAGPDGDGEKQHVCDVCGKVEKEATKYDDEGKPTEPGTPEDEDAPGKIENITDPKENACGGTIEVSKSDILETFPLEKKELESVENGSDISLKLEVKDIAEEVKASEDADKINAAVEDAIEKLVFEMNEDNSITEEKKAEEIAKVKNAKVAAVLDVTIEKFIDGEDAGRVTELKKPLRVYINLPEGLYEEGRSYFVVREHNGEYEALELHIIDAARGWFESQYYSKFYIMYTEKAPEPVPTPVVEPEPVHEHEFGEWKTTQNASWTKKGIETRTCECGEKETRVVEESWTEWLVGAVGRKLKRFFS